jgi:hypothetical protein
VNGNVDLASRQNPLDLSREQPFAAGARIDRFAALGARFVTACFDDLAFDLKVRPRLSQRFCHHRCLRAGEFAPPRAQDNLL